MYCTVQLHVYLISQYKMLALEFKLVVVSCHQYVYISHDKNLKLIMRLALIVCLNVYRIRNSS